MYQLNCCNSNFYGLKPKCIQLAGFQWLECMPKSSIYSAITAIRVFQLHFYNCTRANRIGTWRSRRSSSRGRRFPRRCCRLGDRRRRSSARSDKFRRIRRFADSTPSVGSDVSGFWKMKFHLLNIILLRTKIRIRITNPNQAWPNFVQAIFHWNYQPSKNG